MSLHTLFAKKMRGNIAALLAGLLLTLSFAPFELFPLAIVSPFLFSLTLLSVKQNLAFLRGWLYGIGLFGTGIYWIFTSVHVYGEASIPVSVFITFGLMGIVSLFPAFTAYLLTKHFPTTSFNKWVIAFPIYWVFSEWIRSWLFTGFTWLSIGYSQTHFPLKGYASFFGVYGISYALILTSSLLLDITLHHKQYSRTFLRKEVGVLALIWIVGGVFSCITWTTPFRDPITVSLVQGNIPQELKWNPEQLKPTIERYMLLTKPHWDSDIVVWPEGAIPVPIQLASNFIDSLDRHAKIHHMTFMTGIPSLAANSSDYYNSVIALGISRGAYAKRRLVPFGEFTPLPALSHRILKSLNIPMSNFISSKMPPEFINANGVKISTFICYEIAFPEQVNTVRADLNLLLTVSNDAWFGHSIAQPQHLQMAQMRALELQRPVLFASNDGITAIIDYDGSIKATIPRYTAAVLTDTVQPREGQTPWQQTGFDPQLLLMIIGLLYLYRAKKRGM